MFRKRIGRVDPGVRPGEVVAVRRADGTFLGRAFWSPRSVIAARVIDREEFGAPIDGEWFRALIDAADRRRRLRDVTDSWRVVNSEGDGISGLIIDRYAELGVIEVGARGVFEHLGAIEDAVRALPGIRRTIVRADPEVERIEGFSAVDRGGDDGRVIITEHGIRYHVDARRGHKTGFFLDQRDARAEAARLARARTVLDLCCYTGGFALSAARGGAASVTAVDLDEAAIEVARANAALNGLAVSFEHADAFDFLRAGAMADLVILDPPKLAMNRRGLPMAEKKSVDLNTLALRAVRRGGLLFTFSCTGLFPASEFERQVVKAARRAGRDVRITARTTQPDDHPVAPDFPEGRYLHGLLLAVAP